MQVRILHNARIFTGITGHPWAHTLAIANGTIIGIDQAALAWKGAPEVATEDLRGALVIPGITDAHIHLMWYSQSLRELDLRDLDRAETLASVAKKGFETAPGTWITGRGWDQNIWEDTRYPTAAELDRAAPRHPVLLNAKSGHVVVANTLAMKAAAVTAETPDPIHGLIGRDEHGQPNGLFFEDAIARAIRAKPKPDMETLVSLIEEAQRNLLARGITGVHDVDGNPAFGAFQMLKKQKRLRIRIVKYVRLEALEAVIEAGLQSGFGDDQLLFGGLKLFADGMKRSLTTSDCSHWSPTS